MLNVHDMNLLGTHNYENVCAAIAMTKAVGIPDDIIIEQIKNFKAVEHRIEYVATKMVYGITTIQRELIRKLLLRL